MLNCSKSVKFDSLCHILPVPYVNKAVIVSIET